MGFLIFIIIAGGLIWLLIAASKLATQQQAEDSTFAGEHQGWDIYKSAHVRGILAIDHSQKRIAVGTVTSFVEYSWSDISGVELEKNGQSLTQTNRGSQAMGAAVGAVLLGPVGLLMGGLTGSKRQKERVNELCLKIMIDDRTAPVHRVIFFRMKGNGIDASSLVLKEPAAKLEHFHALISNAIRHDSRNLPSPADATETSIASSTDQIARLWELKQAGALTNEEFTSEKNLILERSRLLSN